MAQLLPSKIWPKSFEARFSEYPHETTIHGVKYIANRNRPLADRIFWITIFAVSISFLGYFVNKISNKWMENQVMIVEGNKPTYIFDIPFPAVTVCPATKFKVENYNIIEMFSELNQFSSKEDFWGSDYGKKYKMVSLMCRESFERHTKRFLQDSMIFKNETSFVKMGPLHSEWIDTLIEISPSFKDVFESCQIRSWSELKLNYPSFKNCERLFAPIITNDGLCYTFNTISDVLRNDSLHTEFTYHQIDKDRDGWDPENGYSKAKAYPFKAMMKGGFGLNGFKFVLTVNESDTSALCYPKRLGFKLVLHSPAAYPHTYDNYISLGYGKAYTIAVKPKIVTTVNDLRSFKPEVRNCYFNDERKLKFYTFYNQANCRLECYANYTAIIVGGVSFASPRDPNTTNFVLPRKNYGWDMPDFYKYLDEHFKVWGRPIPNSNRSSIVDCNCLPECNSILYKYEILKSEDDFLDDADKNDGNVAVDESIGHKTTVEIIFNELSFIGDKRVPVYTFESLISDFGGLLGLFMGGSVLSLIELFYFLTIRNCFKSRTIVLTSDPTD